MDLHHPLAAVTSGVDGDVLAVLALADEAFTPGQIRRLLTSRSEHGIRKSLNRLVDQGIVSIAAAGNAYVYRLNRQHLAADPIIALARLRETLLARIEATLETWNPRPVYSAVFGSAARGGMHSGSDIDIFIVSPETVDIERWATLVAELAATVTQWTGNDTRILQFSESEVCARPDAPVLQEIRDHGLTVAGARAWIDNALHSERESNS